MTVLEEWSARFARVDELRARGDRAGADVLLETTFSDALVARRIAPALQALLARARIQMQLGRPDGADELANLALVLADAHGELAGRARAKNFLGVISLEQQQIELARTMFEDALEDVFGARDDKLIAAISSNLGTIANIQGRLAEARTHYLESLGSNVRCESRTQLVMAYNNLGMVCADSEEWMEALVYYGRALEIAEEERDETLVAIVQLNQAEPLIETGELAQALSCVSAADGIAKRLGNAAIQADAARFFARLSRIQGEAEVARRYVSESLAIAERADLELHLAEALEESALLHLQQRDIPGARADFDAAHSRFEALGAVRDAERVAASQRELLSAS